jgi:hypothetical protein
MTTRPNAIYTFLLPPFPVLAEAKSASNISTLGNGFVVGKSCRCNAIC